MAPNSDGHLPIGGCHEKFTNACIRLHACHVAKCSIVHHRFWRDVGSDADGGGVIELSDLCG